MICTHILAVKVMRRTYRTSKIVSKHKNTFLSCVRDSVSKQNANIIYIYITLDKLITCNHNTLMIYIWYLNSYLSIVSMSTALPIPEIRPFQNLTMKIHGQGHACVLHSVLKCFAYSLLCCMQYQAWKWMWWKQIYSRIIISHMLVITLWYESIRYALMSFLLWSVTFMLFYDCCNFACGTLAGKGGRHFGPTCSPFRWLPEVWYTVTNR